MAGKFGIFCMNVDDLNNTNKDDQQNTSQGQDLKKLAAADMGICRHSQKYTST
jgi:hypothetical protein